LKKSKARWNTRKITRRQAQIQLLLKNGGPKLVDALEDAIQLAWTNEILSKI
jgi:hypothetical protein